MICAFCCFIPGFIGKITLQIPFYRPHSDPWVISMSQLNLIIGPAQLQEYDDEKEKEEERQRKQRLLKAFEDKFKASGKQKLFFNDLVLSADICLLLLGQQPCMTMHFIYKGTSAFYRVKVNREGSLTGTLSRHHWLPGLWRTLRYTDSIMSMADML